MIEQRIVCRCTSCKSDNLVKNGHSVTGKQQYICKACGRSGTINPTQKYSEQEKERILNAYFERPSMRGIQRIFGVSRPTLVQWLKKNGILNPAIENTLQPPEQDDVLELDEVWSFVQKRANKRWLWIALCRRTRQVVAYFIGDRSEVSCKGLWEKIPESYRRLHSYSDLWDAYKKVFPKETHRSVGKESGQTNHIERWNNTLR